MSSMPTRLSLHHGKRPSSNEYLKEFFFFVEVKVSKIGNIVSELSEIVIRLRICRKLTLLVL